MIDNGVGVSEKRFEEIYQHFEEGSRNESGEVSNIGLKNVYVRLKLYYGELATLQLKNVNEGGFLVSIMLPISVEGGQK